MNKIKTISKIVYKNKKILFLFVVTLVMFIFALIVSLFYMISHDINYLIVYTSIISILPILLPLLLYFLFSNGKMIIFRSVYKVFFENVILTALLLMTIPLILTLLPIVYYSLNNNQKLILFFVYILLFECSLTLFSIYFKLFLQNPKVSIIFIAIITQLFLSINSLNLIDNSVAKFISEHFTIIGILLMKKINWAFYMLITLIPILSLLSILTFKNKIDWAFYAKRK